MADFSKIYSSFHPGTAKSVIERADFDDVPDDHDPIEAPAALFYCCNDLFGRPSWLLNEHGKPVTIISDERVHLGVVRALSWENYSCCSHGNS